jgi:hypothetical protein
MGYRHYGREIFFDHNQRQRDQESAAESLAAALRFAALALNFDPMVQAGKLLTEAVARAGLFGDHTATLHELVKQQELAALGDIKATLARGAENIKDHDMRACYLARLGTSL